MLFLRSLPAVRILCTYTFYILLHLFQVSSWIIYEQLKDFFADSYLRKNTGVYNRKIKNFAGVGFNTAWEMFHVHHACVRGGNDGIYIGLADEPKTWPDLGEDSGIVTPMELNRAAKFTPTISLSRFERKHLVGYSNFTFIEGATLFSNCFRQDKESSNPAHWMMKMGLLFELANYHDLNKKDKSMMFRFPLPTPFQTNFMHQCADPDVSNWEWGKVMWDIVKDKAIDSGMFYNMTDFITVGYQESMPRLEQSGEDLADLICFEDLHISMRTGWWMQGSRNLIDFRDHVTKYFNAKNNGVQVWNQKDNEPEKVVERNDPVLRQDYCPPLDPAKGETLSTARIKIFKRTGVTNKRSFLNLDEVVQLAQSYTNIPVEVFTVNETVSLLDQIKMFNTFDILITPHGSHLTNGIFVKNPRNKAVIEVVSHRFDGVFWVNYNKGLGFADYLFSQGHTTPLVPSTLGILKMCPFPSPSDFKARNCTSSPYKYPNNIIQPFINCKANLHTRFCDIHVNLALLKSVLDDLFALGVCPALYSAGAGARMLPSESVALSIAAAHPEAVAIMETGNITVTKGILPPTTLETFNSYIALGARNKKMVADQEKVDALALAVQQQNEVEDLEDEIGGGV